MSQKRKKRSHDPVNEVRKHHCRRQEDEEDEEEAQSDSEGKSSQTPGRNHNDEQVGSDCGIIEEFSLKNFMCHSLLGPFRFGPNLNYLIGNNGSGKSAVLTALIVGLGGKTLLTSRGSSSKSFIKHGQSSADISITLRNCGADPYKHSLYGDSIVIEHHICCAGRRLCKLKNKSGKIVSKSKEELTNILDHFNIQVDNPVSILNQEMSKQFLHSKDESDKYKFFMKATHLEQMQNDYQEIIIVKNNIEEKLQRQESSLRDLSKVVKEKKEEFQRIVNLQDRERQILELLKQLAWAEVRDEEVARKTLQDQLRVEANCTVKFDRNVEEHQAKLKAAELKHKSLEDQLNQLKGDLELFMEQNVESKRNLEAKKRAVKTQKALLDSLQNQIRAIEKDCYQLDKRIDELNSMEQQVTESERAERARSLLRLREELADLKAQDATLMQQIEHFKQAINRQKEENSYKLRREYQDVNRSLDTTEQRLRQLTAGRTERLSRFNTKFPQLLQMIDVAYRAGKFQRRPIGPIGYFLKVQDPEMALAVESCLKGILMAFCCHHVSDVPVLENIMADVFAQGWRPQIFKTKFLDRMHDTSARAVKHPLYLSVLESLEIENPIVANALIDQCGIESILLIKENATARQVMQRGAPPKNCKQAFTKSGDQVFANRYYACDSTHPKYLHEDFEAEIRQLQTEKVSRQEQLQKASERVKLNQEEIHKNETQLKNKVQQQLKIQGDINKLMVEITQVENIEEPAPLCIGALEEERQEYTERKENLNTSLKEALDRHQQATSELQAANDAYKDIVANMNEIKDKAGPIMQNVTAAGHEVDKIIHNLKHYETKRREHLKKIAEKKTELEKLEKSITKVVEMAEKVCSQRVEVTMPTIAIRQELKRLQNWVRVQDTNEDQEAIIRGYHETVKRFQTSKRHLKTMKYYCAILDKIMDHRHRNYIQFRQYVSWRCMSDFDLLLSTFKYQGTLTFDHAKKTLSITVKTSQDKGENVMGDVRTLSGGERSFSTVCFLLSIWNIMESPFRCLDEFDVFMDMVNRRISMNMMLQVAKMQTHRQFIFLTPQNISSVKVSPLIKVLRMADPVRGQTTLPFQAVQRANDEEDTDDGSSA